MYSFRVVCGMMVKTDSNSVAFLGEFVTQNKIYHNARGYLHVIHVGSTVQLLRSPSRSHE